MKRKGLILGGARFHGFLLAEHLSKNGDDVYVLNRGNYRKNYDFPVNRLIADRNNSDQLEGALSDLKFDYIIDNNAYNPEQIKSLFKVIRDRCDHYIFTSSAAIYLARNLNHALKENEAAGIASGFFPPGAEEYARGKLAAEEFLRNENGNHTVIRLTNVFGEGDFVGKTFYFYNRIRDHGRILLEEEIARFSAIYSGDIPRIFDSIILNNFCFGKTFNLADSKSSEINEFLKCISSDYDKKRVIRAPAKDITEMGYIFPWGVLAPELDITFLERTIGPINFTPMEVWVKRALDWEKENLEEKRKTEYKLAREKELEIIGKIK